MRRDRAAHGRKVEAMIEVAASTANHAAAGVVVAFAIGLPLLVVALSAIGAVLASRSER